MQIFLQDDKKIVDNYDVYVYVCCLIRNVLNFHWKTDNMYALWVDVIVVCQHDLKSKLLHALVGAMSNFFFSLYIIEHSLEYHFKYSRDVLGNVSVIFFSFYELPNFFNFSLASL